MNKPIIYQMLPRLWGNVNPSCIKGGTLSQNGTGKFSSIDNKSLEYLKWLGCSHVWFTGVIRHATKETDGGCMKSNSQFVKGQAGSPYAITDYYDVNPYLADNPSERLQEFKQLINRTHEAGLKVLIDFVPNHVSRDYGMISPVPGHPILGSDDDASVHWKAENDFFYYPGQVLILPCGPSPDEEAFVEYPAKATGNSFTPSPSSNDWYETAKINYCNFHTPTWDKMLDVILYWAEMGVDGFRCDMVEMVPHEFMKWLIAEAKNAYPELTFIAEVYQKDLYNRYIREVGFDLLYDKSGLYDTLRVIIETNVNDFGLPIELWQSAEGITRNWQYLGDLQPYMLNFLENHDEQRFASDYFGRDGANGFAALYVSLMLNRAGFMLYMGGEIGERGMDNEGFSDRNGRTTIFDWWSVEGLRKIQTMIHEGTYGQIAEANSSFADASLRQDETYLAALAQAGLTQNEARIFGKYAQAMQLAGTSKAISSGTTYDLCYCNATSNGFDKSRHFAFLRDYENETILVAANFSPSDAAMELSIPQHAFQWLELPQTKLLNPDTKIRLNVPAFDAVFVRLGE